MYKSQIGGGLIILKIICVAGDISVDPIPTKGWLDSGENIKSGHWIKKINPMLSIRYHKIHQYIINIQSRGHIYLKIFFFVIGCLQS